MRQSKNYLVICLAVMGLIATSACSRSNGSTPQAQTPPPATAPAAPGVPKTQSELDAQSGKSAQDSRAPQKHKHDKGPQVSNDQDPSDRAPQAPQTAPQGIIAITYDPTGMTPSQIFEASEKQGPATVGIISNLKSEGTAEPLYVSGSGQDDLLQDLERVVDTQTKPSRVKRDEDFAKRVSNGRFEVTNWSTREVVLDLMIKGETGSPVYRFTGTLDNKLLFRGGDLRRGQNISVEAACMDMGGGCGTVYVKVQDGKGGIVRTAHMLIRQTAATLFTHADGFGLAQNEEFDTLLQTLVRTDEHAGDLDALNHLILRTSETINGQANFKVEMGIRSNSDTQEWLNIGGPLVKLADDINLSTPAQVLSSSSPSARTIRSVSLIKNDGRGNLTLAVTVRKASAQADEDTMELTVARIHKPVRPLIIK
jgi:hypothetical protein